jgi:Rha family phage regulatory protein
MPLFTHPAGAGSVRTLNPIATLAPAPASVKTEAASAVSVHKLATEVVRLSKKQTPVTTSRDVAAAFGKQHKHVMRDIRTLQATLENVGNQPTYFADHHYRDSNQQLRPEVIMTEEGFMLLAMGFTGEEALRLKLTFLAEFKRLRELVPTAAPASAAEPPLGEDINRIARLAYYTHEEFQKQCVKGVAHYVLAEMHAGLTNLTTHHRTVMKLLTGHSPSQYRNLHLAEGRKVKSFSGRALLRRFEPAKAASAAVLDDAVRLGTDLRKLEHSGAANTLPAAFESILLLGLQPADLPEAA